MPTLEQIIEEVRLATPEDAESARQIGRAWAAGQGFLNEWDAAFALEDKLDPREKIVQRMLTQVGILSRQFGFELIPWQGFIAPRVFVLRFRLHKQTLVRKVMTGFADVAARIDGIVLQPLPIVRLIEGGIEVLAIRRQWDICHLFNYVRPGDQAWKPWDKFTLPMAVAVDGTLIDDPVIHMLIAGTTGGGKTAALNAMLGGVTQKYLPEHVQWLLIDPELVGLARFKDLAWFWDGIDGKLPRHPLTDRLQAVSAFRSVLVEHEQRLQLLNLAGVDTIARYNRTNPDRPMTHLLVVVDEFAVFRGFGAEVVRQDLEDDSKKSLESIAKEGALLIDSIAIEISQRCRKTGIHLILATQRAAKETLIPELRDNLGTRIVLRCVSEGGSQVAFGSSCDWAMQLTGNGDMWVVSDQGIRRGQGLYVDDEKVLSDGRTRFDRLIESAKQYRISHED